MRTQWALVGYPLVLIAVIWLASLTGGVDIYVEFTCEQTAEALAQRDLWQTDFVAHFNAQLVTVVPGCVASATLESTMTNLGLLFRTIA